VATLHEGAKTFQFRNKDMLPWAMLFKTNNSGSASSFPR
jgi:hypothetical protein